jgi:hypothetical protein
VIDVNSAIRALTPTSTATPGPTDTPVPPTPVPPTATQAAVAPPPQQAAVSQPSRQGAPSQAPVAPPTPTPDSGEMHAVTIQAQEEAWVTVTVDGVVEFAAVMDAGDTLNFEGESIEIYTSNATNVYLWADGEDLGLVSESNWEGSASIP